MSYQILQLRISGMLKRWLQRLLCMGFTTLFIQKNKNANNVNRYGLIKFKKNVTTVILDIIIEHMEFALKTPTFQFFMLTSY